MSRTTKHTPKNSPAEYTRLVSGIYNSPYALAVDGKPQRVVVKRRKLTEEEKHARKVERELATTLRRMTPEFQERERKLHREQQRRWAKENREKIAEAQRKWKEANPDYHKQADRDRYERDAEKKKERARAYYERNKEKINAKRRAKAANGSASPMSTDNGSRAKSGKY